MGGEVVCDGLGPADQGDQSNPSGFRGLALRGGPPGRRGGHKGASCGDTGFGGVAGTGRGALVDAAAVGVGAAWRGAAGRIGGVGTAAGRGVTLEGVLSSG